MGLKATIATGVATAFASMDDLVTTGLVLERVSSRVYDPNTLQTDDVIVNDSFSGLFTGYKQSEVDDVHILKEDQKLLVEAVELTAAPLTDDTVVNGTERWDVVSVDTPPGESLYILQIRKNK